MALQKTKTLQSGFSGDYWRIIQINTNYDRDDVTTTIALYKSSTARNSNSITVFNNTFQLTTNFQDRVLTVDDVSAKDVVLSAAYTTIKEMAIAENAKEDDDDTKNTTLAWFFNALDV